MNTIIDETKCILAQQAYHEYAIIAFEIFHSLQRNFTIATHHVAIKLDLNKAFDRVE